MSMFFAGEAGEALSLQSSLELAGLEMSEEAAAPNLVVPTLPYSYLHP